jgi:hypothetical protein
VRQPRNKFLVFLYNTVPSFVTQLDLSKFPFPPPHILAFLQSRRCQELKQLRVPDILEYGTRWEDEDKLAIVECATECGVELCGMPSDSDRESRRLDW